jgi:hypothetical protein
MTTFEYRGHQVAISEPFDMGWRRIYIDKEDMGCHGKEAESTARQLVDVMKQMGFEYKGHQVSLGRYIVNGRYDDWFARIDEVASRNERTLSGTIAVSQALIDGHPRYLKMKVALKKEGLRAYILNRLSAIKAAVGELLDLLLTDSYP